MKNLLIILLVILISGCHLTKKVAKSEAVTTQSTQTNETGITKENLKVTNNLITDQETVETTIEFYPTSESIATVPVKDSSLMSMSIPVKGAVKSITVKTTKAKMHDQGTTESAKAQQASKTTIDNSSSSVKTDNLEKPAADPKRWRYIFYILVLCAGAIIYLKRSGVFTWLKSVLSVVRNFLKI